MSNYQYDPDRNERLVSIALAPDEAKALAKFARENKTTKSALIRGLLKHATRNFTDLSTLLEHQDFKPRGNRSGAFKTKHDL